MKPLVLILMLAGATVGGLVLGEIAAPAMSRAHAAAPRGAPDTAPALPPPAPAMVVVPSVAPGSVSPRSIKWSDLTPTDWEPMKQFRAADFSALTDADPKAVAMLKQMRDTWDNAPTNAALDGQNIRIAGYLVPLDETKAGLTDFLLVPYFGACIHTPPPPSNQIIDVKPTTPHKGWHAMDTVWVSGTLRTSRSETYMGVSSYRLEAVRVEPYVKPATDR